MPDVGAEVAHHRFGIVPADQIRLGDLPQSGEPVGRELLQNIAKHFGFGKNPRRFEQNGDTLRLGFGQDRPDQARGLLARFVGVLRVGANAEHPDPEVARDRKTAQDLVLCRLKGGRGGIRQNVEAGDREFAVVEFPFGRGGGVPVERPVPVGEERAVDVVQFDAREAGRLRHIAEVVKRSAVPALGRKREFHLQFSS